jgi:WD40 repeat protein
MRGHEGTLSALYFRDAGSVTSGSGDNTVRVWDVSSGSCRLTLKGHTGRISCLTSYVSTLVSGSKDGTIRLWNLRTGLCERLLSRENNGISFSLNVNWDGTRLAVAVYGEERTLDLWNLEDG